MVLEHEIKGLITKDEYDLILKNNVNKVTDIINQENIYFETKNNFFKNNDSALRVRIKNEEYELTLKVKFEQSNKEYNFNYSKSRLENELMQGHVPNEIKNICSINEDINKKLTITTKRTCIKEESVFVEIDETKFNTVTDYEIEIEAKDIKTAQACFTDFKEKNVVNPKQSQPKIARYIKYNENKWGVIK